MASGPMALSAAYHVDPGKFDGYRFHRARQEPSANVNASSQAGQFTTTGLGSLMFGHGKYACPGRFFASLESKLVLMHVLLNYDLRLRDGVKERPKNLLFADANIPDPAVEVMFRERGTRVSLVKGE
jgi:ent-kaurene oxidase